MGRGRISAEFRKLSALYRRKSVRAEEEARADFSRFRRISVASSSSPAVGSVLMTTAAAAWASIRLIVGELLAGQGVAPGPEVGPDGDDRQAQGEGKPAFEAGPAVGVGAVEDGDDGVGRADAVDVDPEDRVGVEGRDRLDLGLGQEDVMPGAASAAASRRFQARSAWVNSGPAR